MAYLEPGQGCAVERGRLKEPFPPCLGLAPPRHQMQLVHPRHAILPALPPDKSELPHPRPHGLAVLKHGPPDRTRVQVPVHLHVDVYPLVRDQAEGLLGRPVELEAGPVCARKVGVVLALCAARPPIPGGAEDMSRRWLLRPKNEHGVIMQRGTNACCTSRATLFSLKLSSVRDSRVAQGTYKQIGSKKKKTLTEPSRCCSWSR